MSTAIILGLRTECLITPFACSFFRHVTLCQELPKTVSTFKSFRIKVHGNLSSYGLPGVSEAALAFAMPEWRLEDLTRNLAKTAICDILVSSIGSPLHEMSYSVGGMKVACNSRSHQVKLIGQATPEAFL